MFAACLGLHAQGTSLNALNVTISIAGPGTNITAMETFGTASSNSMAVVSAAVNTAAGYVTASVTNGLAATANLGTAAGSNASAFQATNVALTKLGTNDGSGLTNLPILLTNYFNNWGTNAGFAVLTNVDGRPYISNNVYTNVASGGSTPTFSSQFDYNGGSGTNLTGALTNNDVNARTMSKLTITAGFSAPFETNTPGKTNYSSGSAAMVVWSNGAVALVLTTNSLELQSNGIAQIDLYFTGYMNVQGRETNTGAMFIPGGINGATLGAAVNLSGANPSADLSKTLGSSSARWTALYASNVFALGMGVFTNGFASYNTNLLLAGSATSWNAQYASIASGITNTYGTNMTYTINATSGTITLYSAGGSGGVNAAANAYFTGALVAGMSEFKLPANWGIQITSSVGVTAAAHF